MPKPLLYATMVLVILAFVPPAVISRARAVNSTIPRIHLIQDMDNQGKFQAQQANPLFADARAMRPPVEHTVARGELNLDRHYARGVAGDAWATTFPSRVTVNMALLERGRDRFNIYCQPCHGAAGFGDGIVHQHAMVLMNNPAIGNGTSWVAPKSLHEQAIREQPVGQVFNTITNGVRNMAGYASQVPVADRWAIVAYVRALQRSQNARESDVPEAIRNNLPVIPLPVTEEAP